MRTADFNSADLERIEERLSHPCGCRLQHNCSGLMNWRRVSKRHGAVMTLIDAGRATQGLRNSRQQMRQTPSRIAADITGAHKAAAARTKAVNGEPAARRLSDKFSQTRDDERPGHADRMASISNFGRPDQLWHALGPMMRVARRELRVPARIEGRAG